MNIVQTSLSDVIFPDLVKRAQRDPAEGLLLWKRAQMMVAAVIVPAWLLLYYFAEPLIRLAFTDAYVAATPYFQVFLLLMLRQCFQFSTLLRSVEDNASFATSNAIALGINVALIVALMPAFGLWGPTLGLVVGPDLDRLLPRPPRHAALRRAAVARSSTGASSRLAARGIAGALRRDARRAHLAAAHSPEPGRRRWRCSALVYAVAARIILREEYGYVVRAFIAAAARRMNAKRTALIISYWFAPSPAVGAKRFSFLAREFARLGYDVHVITHESRDWIDWKTDASLPVSGQVHRCAESLKLPLAGKGLLQRAANFVLRRLLAPVGWEYLWAARRHAQGTGNRAHLPPGVVIATSPRARGVAWRARSVARRLRWPLILDYRDPWSAHDGRAGDAAPFPSGSRDASNAASCNAAPRGYSTHRRCATRSKSFSPAPMRAKFRDSEWIRSRRRGATAADHRPDRHRARGRNLHGPLAGAGARGGATAARRATPRAPSA